MVNCFGFKKDMVVYHKATSTTDVIEDMYRDVDADCVIAKLASGFCAPLLGFSRVLKTGKQKR